MIQGNKKQTLTVKVIMSKITEYDIFKYYMMGSTWTINQITFSPFRKETNPSFLISNRSGNLTFIDFADTDKRGDCFTFVMKMYNCDFDTALKIIDRDFGLGLAGEHTNTGTYTKITSEYKQPEDLGKRYCHIQCSVRKFTTEELKYWNQYHLSEDDLKANNVYALKQVFLNRQRFPLKPSELVFGYYYDGNWKIYRPYADPKFKWLPNNVPITAMDGKEDIKKCHTAFINKSKKDYMVIKKLFPTTCAVQNEGIACFSHENLEYIKENSKRQILSFDSDPTGVKNSKLISDTFGFDYCNVPRTYLSDGIKDWADLAKGYGMSTVEKILIKKGIL